VADLCDFYRQHMQSCSFRS